MSYDHDCNYCTCQNNDDRTCKCGCHYDTDTGERYGIVVTVLSAKFQVTPTHNSNSK